MVSSPIKSSHGRAAKALFLCLLSIYSFVLQPVFAATSGTGRSATPPATDQANPPVQLQPPPPAEAPTWLESPAGAPDSTPATGNNDPNVPASPHVNESYILGPGDLLLVSDFSSSDTSSPVVQPSSPILPDGTIDIHPVGILKAAGLTLRELTELVNKKAEQFIIKPDIEITVVKVRPNMVYLLGEVYKPGLYTNEAGSLIGTESVVSTTSNLTLISVLQKAGGIKESADVRNVRITRLGSTTPICVNLWQLLVEGDATQDVNLYSGDVVYIPKGGSDFDPDALGLAANQRRRVRIWGAVRQPGFFEMDPSDDVLSMIARAGGFTATATRSWVLLSRVNRDGTVTTRKISISRGIRDPDSVARTHLKPGDLVLVHDSLLKKGAGTLYTQAVYFAFAIGLITYAIFLGNAVTNSGSSGSGTTTAIPVTAPTTSTTTSSPGLSP